MSVTVTSRPFAVNANGQAITEYTLTRGSTRLVMVDKGCTFLQLLVPDKNGNPVNVLVAPTDAENVLGDVSSVMGQTVGRVCNRTEKARFTLNGKEYRLSVNNGENHLHGSFGSRVFSAEPVENGLAFTMTSPAAEEGYPGDLTLTVTVTLPAEGQLEWQYTATATEDTPVNITNHAYFNLAGEGDIKDHALWLASRTVCEHRADGCPTGAMLPVEGTVMDFTAPRVLGKGLAEPSEQLVMARGYDHNFALDAMEEGGPAARLSCPRSGIEMTLFTTQPAVQVYTGNYLQESGVVDAKGRPFFENQGVALETQHYPCSLSNPQFPSIILKQGETYTETTRLAFACE